jgi:hypothetical protein
MKRLAGTIMAAAVLLAAPAEAAAQPASAAQTSAPRVTRDFLLGRWTDTNDCTNSVDFLGDGRFVTSEGAKGRWRLEGNVLTFSGTTTVSARIAATSRDAITLTHGDGTVGSSTRCAAAAARRTMPPLPATSAAAVAMSRPIRADFLIGRWTDDGDCGSVINFRPDGTFVIPNASGRWRLEGERLSFIGERTVTARARAVGGDRILLIYDDNSLGQSMRC